MKDEERQLWTTGEATCVMISCCAGAELQVRRASRSEAADEHSVVVLRELYPTKSDLYERARELEIRYRSGRA